LLTIATLICLVLCTLILFFVLKSRIYDIGVFRTRGMPRINVAMFITGEIFVVTTFAFIIAMIVYWNTFLNFIRYQYSLEDTALMIQFSNFGKVEGRYFDVLTFRDFLSVHEAFLPTNPYIFIIVFLISILITVIIGLASVFFISRHEPMKIMTKH
ncbi:MAG: FtsX-like permease family protein, partial [Oscillospiraceae bacterium]|nr:FtsX-like permease family protein [Oscillospiraceae bacterium]